MTKQTGPRSGDLRGTTHQAAALRRAGEAGAALRMWRNGYTFAEISAALGLSRGTAFRRVARARAVDATPVGDDRPAVRDVRARPVFGIELPPGPELMRLRPRPRVRCRAHRRDGAPCGAWSVHGAVVCRVHGGAAGQVLRAARARHARDKAAMVLGRWERSGELDAFRRRPGGHDETRGEQPVRTVRPASA